MEHADRSNNSEGQDNGIWAWDCLKNEAVLLIPSVFALLGDNPMQSEMACHVRTTGKYFCRIYKIANLNFEGENEVQEEEKITPSGPVSLRTGETDDSDLASEVSAAFSDNGSEASIPAARDRATEGKEMSSKGKKTRKRRRKPKNGETMAEMVDIARNFLAVISVIELQLFTCLS